MIITEKSRVIPYQLNDLTEEEIYGLHIPQEYFSIIDNLTKIDGNIYYFKGLRSFGLINELIGSYLAKRIGLDTVDYQIGVREQDNYFFAFSKVFYEEGYRYQSMDRFLKANNYKDCFHLEREHRVSSLPIYYNMKTLKLYRGTPFYDNNLKLIALDLKMGQHDRCKVNMQIKIDSLGTIDLAPIYDYERAYMNREDLAYANPLAFIRYTEATFRLLFLRYPELREYVEFLKDITMEEILAAIEEEKGIKFQQFERDEYFKSQAEVDKLIGNIKVKKFF